MIKLFLITLLCATLVFGNPPVQKFRDVKAWENPMNRFVNKGDDLMGHLVRRSAHRGGSRTGGQGGMNTGMSGGGETSGQGGSGK